LTEQVSIGFKLPNCGGVLCRPEWATPATIHDLAARADRLAFDGVWLHDHLVTPRELRDLGPLSFYEPLITMATLAQAFPRLTVGVATVVLPLRDPVLLAKQIGTLDGFFPGRLIFGLGAGRYESEFEAVGVDLFQQRGKVSKEYLEIIGALLTEDPVTYEGAFRQLADVSMHPKPAGPARSPIWYAGNAPVAAARAGRHADGWIGATLSPGEFSAIIGPMLRARDSVGRDPSDFSIAVSATVERSRAVATASNVEPLHQHASTITGSTDQIAAQLNHFVAIGATHFLLSLRADQLDQLEDDMEWFAAEVLPLVQRNVRNPTVGADMDRKGGVA
jgi:probable F420-dependent oxidoreductase